jgi:hypothetical protein
VPRNSVSNSPTIGETEDSILSVFPLRHFVFGMLCVATIGCGQKSKNAPLNADADLFVDVTTDVGVDMKHVAGGDDYFMPRSVGSGAAFLDFDDDGLLDILLLQNGGPNSGATHRLYRQDPSGKFVDSTAGSGLDVDGFAMGVAVGDINNDGKVDVLISEYGNARLFLNQSDSSGAKFVDITKPSGLSNSLWGTSCCIFDYDRDGWLDMLLVNYVSYDPSRWCADGGGRQEFCGPDAFNGRPSKLYRNLGDVDHHGVGDAKFEDVTVSSGLSDHPGPGLGVFCADFDGDRWPDIFVANDGKPNHLWINQTDGTFKEEAVSRGLGYNSMGDSEADMGIAIGDVSGDGFFDLFVTHLTTETHTLWSQGPRGIFVDRTATSGLASTKWRGTGFGTVMADLDNDGDLDLALANGSVLGNSVHAKEGDFWSRYAEQDQILLNDGNGKFLDASTENSSVSKVAGVSRGLACADFNNDGSLDLLFTKIAGPPALFKNVKQDSGNWLLVRAIDEKLNRDAYGAEVYVFVGDKTFMRWVNPGYSYLCSNDPRAHFGLGSATEVTEIKIVWPDGSVEAFPGVKVNQLVTIAKGQGKPITIDELAVGHP